MKSAIITGAYGLVGKHLCKVLQERDIKVIKVKFDELDAVVEPVDYIVHCAGYGQPLMFTQDKIATIEINTKTTNELFKYLKEDGSFLFVSTSEVYSGAESPYTEMDIGTTTPQHSRACYIEGKRCGEAIVMAHREQGYNAKIARLALAYGEGTKKGDKRVLNQFIEQALTTGEIKLLDKGEAMRTYCYVGDVAEMMVDILLEGTQPVYNVGGQSRVSIRELADMVATLTNAKVTLGEKSLSGAPDDVELSLGLVLTEFPREFVDMVEGLTRTIKYQKKLYEA